MLTLYGSHQNGPITLTDGTSIPSTVNWIDVFQPTAEELALVQQAMGSRIPTLEELSDIASSSRLSVEGSTLLMSLPATTRDESGFPCVTPVGFILNRDRLTTVRFAHLQCFDRLAQGACPGGALSEGGLGATVSLLEMIVDQLADVLERVGGELDGMSRRVFSQGLRNRRPRRATRVLASMLRRVGETGELVSKVSETLLGLNRIVPFLGGKAQDLVTPDLKVRLDTIGQDAKSLREYEEHLSSKTQFMLDALLGLANIEQNNVFRVLTVVSVIGIPPTFFASMYGMNFKSMPEYDWSYGYVYGLTVIVCSGLIPAVWFKIKGWW